MKTAFGILWRDIKLLLRNPVALLVVGALLVLPGLYAWYCIIANWDPYANTGSMPIAVVNEDAGAKSDLAGEINIGAQVTEQLHDNDRIEWHFYDSADEALEDTRYGICYATIVFPESLSEDMAGIFAGSAHEPTMYYYPNQKFNAVATKVTDSAVQTLQRQVNQAFTAKVNEKVLVAVQDGAYRAEDAAGKTQASALGEVRQAQENIRAAVASLDEAASSIASWRTAAAGGQETLAGTEAQLPVIRDGLSTASADLEALRKKTTEFDSTFSGTLLQANQLVSGLSARLSTRVANAGANVEELSGNAEGVLGQLRGVRSTIDGLLDILPDGEVKTQLEATLDEVDATMANLQSLSDRVSAAAANTGAKAAALNETVQESVDSANAASGTFSSEILPKLTNGTSELAESLSGLSGAVAQFEPQVGQLRTVLSQADSALDRADASIGQSKTLLQAVGDNLQATVADLGGMGTALEMENLTKLLNISPDNMGAFVSSPVHMVTEEVYPVSNYGTAVAPFYTNLALWVGCFILISVVRLEVDRRGFEDATTTQRYFGRWLLFIILSLMQSQAICGVDILLGIDCANPAWFMLAGAVCSFAYMNLIFALAITFRNIGKTLCILLLIMQVPGSSGMYPIEMMPGFFQAINPLLPFTYGIDAMREALCGMYGSAYFQDLALLFTLVPVSLVLGLGVRPYLLNLTQLFDEEMGKVGFFATEEHGQGRESGRMMRIMRTLANSDVHRDELEERAWRFNSRYPRLRRVGSIALIAAPFVFLAVMLAVNLLVPLDENAKLAFLMVMLVVLLLMQAGLIVLEHAHRTIAEETRLLGSDLMMDYATLVDQADDARHAFEQQVDEKRVEIREGIRAEVQRRVAVLSHEEAEGESETPDGSDAPDAPAAPSGGKHARHVRDSRKRLGAAREIALTDLRLGFQSVIGVVVMALLVITPSLYAWFNIAGSWDPYSRTDGLKVAVANDDEGFKGDLLPITVNVGDLVVSQLRGNNNFNWQFVSTDEATSGIQAGDYYASIVIPADFSKNMLTYLTEGADYPDVIYYTNEKENPIAPLITQKGADSIQESIRRSFSERIDEVVLTLGADVMEYLTQPRVANYATTMAGHLDDAVRDMQNGANTMRTVADLSGMVAGVVDTAGVAMDGIRSSAGAAKASAAQAQSGIANAGAAFDEAGALVQDVTSQSSSGLDRVAAEADAALVALQDASADAPAALQMAYDRVTAWVNVVSGLYDTLESAAEDKENSAKERASYRKAADQVKPMKDALTRLQTALKNARDGSETAPENIAAARAELQDLLVQAKAGSADARGFYQESVKGSAENLKGTLKEVSDSADRIVGGLETSLDGLAGGTESLPGQLRALESGLGAAANRLDGAALNVANAKNRVNEALGSDDVRTMAALLLGADTTRLAERLAAPVQEHREALFPVANYGSSMAPFYTVLSLWVGALVMVSTMKVHLTPERAEELRRRFRLKPRHEYLGRLGIFSFVGLLQALLVSLGDLCLLHIQCMHPVLFVLECVIIGQVFTLIVYTFTELFGDVGKAVCVILLIMQVAASGGTFPIEMLGVLQSAVPFLPFYHGMTALQGCVAGIYHLDTFVYLGVLLFFVAGMFLMGIVARRPFRFVTDWVEGQLEKTHYL